MAVKFANNVSTTLSSAINATQTTISVADASGLPSLSSGDYIYLTIDTDTASPTLEVVKVTAVSSNDLTVVRGQDGTTASSFSAGVKVELRVTAAALGDISSQAQTAADTESVSIDGDTMTGQLNIHYGSPTLRLKDTTDDDDHHIQFTSSTDAIVYSIDSQNATSGDAFTFYSASQEIVQRIGSANILEAHANVVKSKKPLEVTGTAWISGTMYIGSTNTASDQLATNNGTDIFLGTSAKGLRTYRDLHTNAGNHKYWHAGNDGANSGLDADKLDGQHGSYYLNYSNFTNTPTIPTLNDTLDSVTDRGATTTNAISTGAITANGDVTANKMVTKHASILRAYRSSWSYPTHDIIYNGWTSSTGDYTTLKAAGNSSGPHGVIVAADQGIYFGQTNAETGAVAADNQTTPLDTNWAHIDTDGLDVRIGTIAYDGTTIVDSSRNLTNIGTISSGAITASGSSQFTSNTGNPSVWIKSTRPTLAFTDTNSFTNDADRYIIRGGSDNLLFQWFVDGSGTTTTATLSKTGNLTITGALSGSLASTVTATTQSASDDSTKVATTAYVTTAIDNIVGAAPGSLDTLNELAAALGDDANFSTTVTNSIATKLAKAGGTMTGNLTISRTAPVIVLNDTDATNTTNQIGYMSFQRQGSETGYVGYGSSGNSNFYVTGGNNVILRSGGVNTVTVSNTAVTAYKPLKLDLSTSSSGTTGTTFLEIDNDVGGDLSQQQSFIDFIFRDTNTNETPQVRIGAQVGRNADADDLQKEGSGAFVVYTNNADTDSGAAGTSLAERFRVDYAGNATITGSLTSGAISATGNSVFKGSSQTTGVAWRVQDSGGVDLIYALNTGEVLIPHNYLYVNASQGAYFTGAIRARGGITNDGGNPLALSSPSDITIKPAAGSDALFFNAHNSESQLRLYNNRQDLSNVPVSSVVGYNSTQVAKMVFYRGGGGSSGYIRFQNKPTNDASLTDVFQIGNGSTVGYGVDILAGGLRIGGTQVISSTSAITSNQTLSLTGNGTELAFTGGNNRIKFSGYRALEGSTDGVNLQIGEGYTIAKMQADVQLDAGKHLTRSNHHTGHLEGSYNNIGTNNSKSNPIYTIGSSYNPNDADLSNMYGIGFTKKGNATFLSGFRQSGWGLYVASDGDARVFLNAQTGVVASTDGYDVGNVNIVTGSRVLQNVTIDGALITSGTIPEARLPTQAKYLRSDAEDTTTGSLIINEDWGSGTYSEVLTLKGSYPSMAFRSTNANSGSGTVWLQHIESSGDMTWYNQANSTDGSSWSKRMDLEEGGILRIQGSSRVFCDAYHPNADAWTTSRTITLSGDLTGSVTLDGSQNVTLSAQVSDNSHNHSNYVVKTGDTMTGQLTMSGTSPQIKFTDTSTDHTDFWIHVNSDRFYVLPDRDSSGGWETDYALELNADTDIGYVFGERIFNEGYHPNADKWTTARTLTLSGDLSGSVSFDGSTNFTLSAQVSNDSHTHDGRYFTETESDGRYTQLNHIRSLGTPAFTAGGGSNNSTTTSALISEMEGDGAFDSYSSVFKTSWSYASNDNLSDAGRFTETAGTAWLTWTDNSSDTVRGNITALAIAPNTGGSAGKVFIYNDQGSSYAPGWREVWTSTSDGAGSGLDADLLDGQQGSHYLNYNNLTNKPSIPSVGNGTLTVSAGTSLSGGGSFTANQSGNSTVTLNVATPANAPSSWQDVVGWNGGLIKDTAVEIHGSGYLRATYLNMTHGVGTRSSDTIFYSSNDDYIRKTNATGMRAALDVPTNSQVVKTSSGTSSNLDNHYAAQMFSWSPSTSGTKPSSSYGQGIAIVSSGSAHNNSNNWITQLAFGTDENSAEFRSKTNSGSWNSWRKIWHSGNDGANSGLDADTVDSLHAASFIRSDADDNVGANTEWQDNYQIRLGNGADFRMWHDGTNTILRNYNHSAGNIYFQGEDLEGTNHALIYMQNDSSRPYVRLFENGSEKLRTTDYGVKVTSPHGYIEFGPANTSHAHLITDRSNFYFNKMLYVDTGVVSSYNEDLYLRRAGSSDNQIQIASGQIYASQPLEIKHEGGANATTGGRFLNAAYSGSHRLGVFSSQYSSGNLLIANGMSYDTGNTGIVSTFSNFSDVRTGVKINRGAVNFTGTQSASNTAVDSALSPVDTFVHSTTTGQTTIGASNGSLNSFLEIRKADNNVSDHLQFFIGSTRMGEIGSQDTSWLRINQVTSKNIYTPRMFRADGGLQTGSGSATAPSICYHNDADTGIFFPGSDVLKFTTGGTTRLTLNNTTATFNMQDVRIGEYLYHNGDTNTYIRMTGDRLRFVAGGVTFIDAVEGGTDYLRFNTRGVTIGSNTAPQATLTVDQSCTETPANGCGTGRDAHIKLENTNTTGSASTCIIFNAKDSGGNMRHGAGIQFKKAIAWSANGQYPGELYFWTRPTSGNQAAAQKLDKDGNAIFKGNVTAYGSLSDRRLKENIEPITDAVAKVEQLEGVTFDYKKDGRRSTGLIAQDLEEVLPEAVYTTTEVEGTEEHKAIHYGNTVGLLVNAIKEQQQMINQLTKRIEELENGNH